MEPNGGTFVTDVWRMLQAVAVGWLSGLAALTGANQPALADSSSPVLRAETCRAATVVREGALFKRATVQDHGNPFSSNSASALLASWPGTFERYYWSRELVACQLPRADSCGSPVSS